MIADRFSCLFIPRFAEFLRSGAHIMPSELQNHERHHEYDKHEPLDSTHTAVTSEDFSNDELDTYTHNPPTPNLFSTLPSLPAAPSLPALPIPLPFTTALCPHPPTAYMLAPEWPLADDDEPFWPAQAPSTIFYSTSNFKPFQLEHWLYLIF